MLQNYHYIIQRQLKNTRLLVIIQNPELSTPKDMYIEIADASDK